MDMPPGMADSPARHAAGPGVLASPSSRAPRSPAPTAEVPPVRLERGGAEAPRLARSDAAGVRGAGVVARVRAGEGAACARA
eukprot:1427097-Alexandrium_andersonii.AAC.1